MSAGAAPGARIPPSLIVPALSVAQLISWGAMYYAFAVLIEPMSAELGLTRTRLSAGYSLGLLVTGLAAWPVGTLIDRGLARPVMAAGSLLAAVGLALHACITDAAQLYAVWVLLGIAMACTLYEPAFAMLIRAYPGDYRRRITILTLLGGLASTAFWPFTAWLLEHGGWRGALWVMAAIQLAVCLPIHLLGVPPDAPRDPPAPPARPAGDATGGPPPSEPARAMDAVRSPVFLLLVASFSTNLLVMASVAAHLIGMLDQLGIGKGAALAIASCIGPMQVVGRLALFALEGRVRGASMTRLIVWLPPAAIALFVALAWPLGTAAGVVALAGALLWGTGNGMLTIVKGTAVAELIGASRVATLNGIAAVPSAFCRASGPFLIAWIWDATGRVVVALAVMGIVSMASALLMTTAMRHRR